MPEDRNDYDFIKDKIYAMKETYPSLREKNDAYVFCLYVSFQLTFYNYFFIVS